MWGDKQGFQTCVAVDQVIMHVVEAMVSCLGDHVARGEQSRLYQDLMIGLVLSRASGHCKLINDHFIRTKRLTQQPCHLQQMQSKT